MRPIDAISLWRKFSINPNTGERYRTRDCDNFQVMIPLEQVQREILNHPTLDVVPVVSDNEILLPKCNRCGKEVHTIGDFCPYCGTKIGLEVGE